MKFFLASTLVVVVITTALWLWPRPAGQGASDGRGPATRAVSATVDKVAQVAGGGVRAVSRWLELATDRPTAAAPLSVDASPTSAPSRRTAPRTARPTEVPRTARPTEVPRDTGAIPKGEPPSTARPTELPRDAGATPEGEPPSTDTTLYSSINMEIVPPEFVRSRLPKHPPPGVRSEDLPEVETIISATGEVESAKLVTQPARVLPAMMLSAVKHWRFQPATRDGQSVRYRLRLRLTNQ